MLDRHWAEARQALLRHVFEGARVQLPVGDWPNLPFAVSNYRTTDCRVAISGYEAVLVHKGMLPSFRQSDIRLALREMLAVFANEVFVLFVARPRRRDLFWPIHIRKVKAYADPARYRRRRARSAAFLHIPKAAGTSAWSWIARSVPSNVYFTSNETLAAFDGDLDEFEAVGGHFDAENLLGQGWVHPVFFILRDPIERIFSFLAHARRKNENVSMLDASFQLARQFDGAGLDAELRDQLFHEGNLMVRMLGQRAGDNLRDPTTLRRVSELAFERLRAPGWSYGLVEVPDMLSRLLAQQFRLADRSLDRLNRSVERLPGAHANAIRRFLVSETPALADRKLYQLACKIP